MAGDHGGGGLEGHGVGPLDRAHHRPVFPTSIYSAPVALSDALDRGPAQGGGPSRPRRPGPGRRRPGGRRPVRRGRPARRGPRHVRHRQLPAGLRRPARSHSTPGRPLGRDRGLPHGRVRGRGTGPPGRASSAGSASASSNPPSPRPPTTSTAWPTRSPSAPATRRALPITRWTCAAWASGRTATWPSTTPRWPTSTIRLDLKVVELDPACRAQQVHEGHFPAVDVGAHATPSPSPSRPCSGPARSWPSCPRGARPRRCASALEGPVTTACPASALRRAPVATLFLEPSSARLPSR